MCIIVFSPNNGIFLTRRWDQTLLCFKLLFWFILNYSSFFEVKCFYRNVCFLTNNCIILGIFKSKGVKVKTEKSIASKNYVKNFLSTVGLYIFQFGNTPLSLATISVMISTPKKLAIKFAELSSTHWALLQNTDQT